MQLQYLGAFRGHVIEDQPRPLYYIIILPRKNHTIWDAYFHSARQTIVFTGIDWVRNEKFKPN